MQTAPPPPNVKASFLVMSSVPTIFSTVFPGSRGPGSKQAGGDRNTRKMSEGVVFFPVSSGLIREIGEFGELQGQCGWVTEAKERASGVGLEWVRIRIPCSQFRATRGVFHEKE